MILEYRPIELNDNTKLANIIRSAIVALKLPIEGTAHSDPSTDNLFQLFQKTNSFYWVALSDNKVL